MNDRPKGFTLIELLVVISIIGLLSSVVLAALNTARNKARDTAVKSEVIQLVTLEQEQFADTGTYAPLAGQGDPTFGWYMSSAQCASPASPPTGAYASQQQAICQGIYTNEKTNNTCASGNYCLWMSGSSGNPPNKYSIMAWLPGAQQFICSGSSGVTSLEPPADIGTWATPGCYNNP
jgi:prepilin-type N-terminal cleavage/methylation domain-containing protein